MRRIIFLSVTGVLNTNKTTEGFYNERGTKSKGVDDHNVETLAYIAKHTGYPEIVIVDDWTDAEATEYLEEKLAEYNLEVSDYIYERGKIREDIISKYLNRNIQEEYRYVIFDYEHPCLHYTHDPLRGHYIQTDRYPSVLLGDFEGGLISNAQIIKSIELLTGSKLKALFAVTARIFNKRRKK